MPNIHESSLEKLHPTQLTVGMIEVHEKRKHLHALGRSEQKEFMRAHAIPAIIGPQQRIYVTDHHHLGRAAYDAGLETGFFDIEADLSGISRIDEFWHEMNRNKWVHPLDENGVRHYYKAIPKRLDKLSDDIYRSLAGYVRRGGGYKKTPTAYAEFVWADFFRRSIPVEDVVADFDAIVADAIQMARSALAIGLPGYIE